MAIVLGLFLHISYFEFLIIILLVFSGLTIETVNTAIEEATDAIDTKWREDIKIAKDVAAGAMLIYAMGAAVLALIIFLPKLLAYLAF
jgi:diacylglycerol kinase